MIEKVIIYKGCFIWLIDGKYQIEGGKRFDTLKKAKEGIIKEWF